MIWNIGTGIMAAILIWKWLRSLRNPRDVVINEMKRNGRFGGGARSWWIP